jgi:SAM-dependent methyltransferase
MNNQLIPTRRNLEQVVLDGQIVCIKGWIFARNGSPIRDLQVNTYPNVNNTIPQIRWEESPDVARGHPGQDGTNACRFHVQLSVDRIPAEGFLVQLRPKFESGNGPLWHVGVGLSMPPTDLIQRVGGAPNVGLEFLDYFVDYLGFSQTESVLDFGCGTGRIAIPLGRFLASQSRYLGVDVDQVTMKWCLENIASRDRRFTFINTNTQNLMYNPCGVTNRRPSIPATTGSISFAFATSVFTHLRSSQAECYFQEIARSLRVGGRALITVFLMDSWNDSSPNASSTLKFTRFDDLSWTTHPDLPEMAMGFKLETFSKWISKSRLRLREVLPGNWNTRTGNYSYQDILIIDRV